MNPEHRVSLLTLPLLALTLKFAALSSLLFAALPSLVHAIDAPGILNHQGRIAVNGVNFDGPGYFKFSLVKDVGGTDAILWHHDGTSPGTAEPAGEVNVTVGKGHYAVLLGDTDAAMTAIPATVFLDNDNVSLRIWFSTTSGSGFEQLAPDRRIASVGYALGSAGPKGDMGNTGPTGSAGPKGDQGDPGPQGVQGVVGMKGDMGNTGPTGSAGPKGDQGDPGPQGVQGVVGVKGDTGNTGPTGVPGPNTVNGNTFYIGSDEDANETGSMVQFGTDATPLMTVFENGDIGIVGNLNLPATSSTTGFIRSGSDTLLHTYGTNNFFAGVNAGNLTMTGSDNTAVGFQALKANEGGNENTVIGLSAMLSNTSGNGNSALGRAALLQNLDGVGNTAVGQRAIRSNTGGDFNVGVGLDSLFNNTGNNNIAIGKSAGAALTNGNSNIAIGAPGVAGESGAIHIGNVSNHTKTFVIGIRGVTTGVADAITVMIDSNGQLGTVSSSRRYKEDIHDMVEAETSARLRQLRPVTFRYKGAFADGEKPIQYGLIAEEVAEVFPDLAVYNEEGQPETVKYHLLAPLLLNEVQKQQQVAEDREREMAGLKQRLEQLETLVGRLTQED